jgi:hypothetical protein
MDAIVATLALVDWQAFATSTWRPSTLGSAKSREDQLWSFLKEVTAEKRSVKFYDLPIVVRWENGEVGGLPHCHTLLAGLERVSIDWMYSVGERWNQRCGDGGSGLLSYMTKKLHFVSGRDTYELGKFSVADRLVINDAAWRLMCRRSGADHVPQLRTL